MIKIPSEYQILAHSITFELPQFEASLFKGAITLCPNDLGCSEWYQNFLSLLKNSIEEKRFFPVVRVSDGEYRFLFGEVRPSNRHDPIEYCKRYFIFLYWIFKFRFQGFKGRTPSGVSVGNYSKEEWRKCRVRFEEGVIRTLSEGMLAAHLSFSEIPFQERFHPSISNWLKKHHQHLTIDNYIPFYFVYALLGSRDRELVFQKKKVLVVHSAKASKREQIKRKLFSYGIKSISWITISEEQSASEKIYPSEEQMACDICIFGAGVGKFNIILQLQGFQGPVIDAGYYFEAWADPSLADDRVLCIV